MSITFIFYKFQIHHHVDISLLALKEIKPKGSGRKGASHYQSVFPREPLNASVCLRDRKLHAALQWMKENRKLFSIWKW